MPRSKTSLSALSFFLCSFLRFLNYMTASSLGQTPPRQLSCAKLRTQLLLLPFWRSNLLQEHLVSFALHPYLQVCKAATDATSFCPRLCAPGLLQLARVTLYSSDLLLQAFYSRDLVLLYLSVVITFLRRVGSFRDSCLPVKSMVARSS